MFLLAVPEISCGVSFTVLDPELALDAVILELVEDDTIQASTPSAGLVIDALECGSYDLEVLVGFEDVVHLCSIPHSLEERMNDALVDGGRLELDVAGTLPDGEGKLARGPDDQFGRCYICPGRPLVRGAAQYGFKNPGDPTQNVNAVAPRSDLLRGGESPL